MANLIRWYVTVTGEKDFVKWLSPQVERVEGLWRLGYTRRDGEKRYHLLRVTDYGPPSWYEDVEDGIRLCGESDWGPPGFVVHWAKTFPSATVRLDYDDILNYGETWLFQGDRQECLESYVWERNDPGYQYHYSIRDGVAVDEVEDMPSGQYEGMVWVNPRLCLLSWRDQELHAIRVSAKGDDLENAKTCLASWVEGDDRWSGSPTVDGDGVTISGKGDWREEMENRTWQLSRQFPDLVFEIAYSVDDGEREGRIEWKNGARREVDYCEDGIRGLTEGIDPSVLELRGYAKFKTWFIRDGNVLNPPQVVGPDADAIEPARRKKQACDELKAAIKAGGNAAKE